MIFENVLIIHFFKYIWPFTPTAICMDYIKFVCHTIFNNWKIVNYVRVFDVIAKMSCINKKRIEFDIILRFGVFNLSLNQHADAMGDVW